MLGLQSRAANVRLCSRENLFNRSLCFCAGQAEYFPLLAGLGREQISVHSLAGPAVLMNSGSAALALAETGDS